MAKPDDTLSEYGRLNATCDELVKLRDATDDEGVRQRCISLIANIEGLKKTPDDPELLRQFAANTQDLADYQAKRRGTVQ
jgi:hypothetical protein